MQSDRLTVMVTDSRWRSPLAVSFAIVAGLISLAATVTTAAPGSESSGSPPAGNGAGQVSTYGAVLVGCEGVRISASGSIDSWDSRLGLYSPALARDNTLVATISPGADLEISGYATVRADLLATRDLVLSNGNLLPGSFVAGRNITFKGNPPCPTGSVHAGGTISTPGDWWLVNKCGGGAGWIEGAEVTLPRMTCDPLDVTGLVAGMIAQYAPPGGAPQWPHSGWREDPVVIDSNASFTGFTIGPGNHPVTVDATKVEYLYIDGDFDLGSSARLHIENPNGLADRRDLLIIVNGNVSTSDASLLTIDPGVSVRLYTNGAVTVGGGAGQDIPASIEIDGKVQPTFGIYTSRAGGTGVSIENHAPLTAVVYAPYTGVLVDNSGEVFGAVRGRSVVVEGAGRIHYDEGLDINSNWDGGPIFITDLSVALTADRSVAAYNEELRLDVSVYGGDAGLFEGVEIDVELPPDLGYTSHQAPLGSSFVDTNGDGVPDRWLLPEVRAQETKVLEIFMKGTLIPDTLVVPVSVSLAAWSGSVDTYAENNEGSLSIALLPSPILTVTKAASPIEIVPGALITYTTSLINQAQAPAHDVYVRGKIDPDLALRLDTFGEMMPFRFIDGDVPSGLSLGVPEYSNDGGLTWGYAPVSGAGAGDGASGFDATVTDWRIPMVGVMNPNSSFRIEYQVMLH